MIADGDRTAEPQPGCRFDASRNFTVIDTVRPCGTRPYLQRASWSAGDSSGVGRALQHGTSCCAPGDCHGSDSNLRRGTGYATALVGDTPVARCSVRGSRSAALTSASASTTSTCA